MNRTLFSDARLSYAQGASDVPLVGATIGDVFDRVAEYYDHEALVTRTCGIRTGS
jgi:hypothetical protein